jgi:hypothetical protein
VLFEALGNYRRHVFEDFVNFFFYFDSFRFLFVDENLVWVLFLSRRILLLKRSVQVAIAFMECGTHSGDQKTV